MAFSLHYRIAKQLISPRYPHPPSVSYHETLQCIFGSFCLYLKCYDAKYLLGSTALLLLQPKQTNKNLSLSSAQIPLSSAQWSSGLAQQTLLLLWVLPGKGSLMTLRKLLGICVSRKFITWRLCVRIKMTGYPWSIFCGVCVLLKLSCLRLPSIILVVRR